MSESIRKIVAVAIACLFLLGARLSWFLINNDATSDAIDRTKGVLMDSAREQGATLAATLAERLQLLKAAAMLMEDAEDLDASQVRADVDRLDLEKTIPFGYVALFGLDGTAIGGPSPFGFSLEGHALLDQVGRGEVAMAYVECSRDGHTILLAAPHYRGGRVAGALVGSYCGERLYNFMVSEAYGGKGYSFLTDGEGNIILNAEDGGVRVATDNVLDYYSGAGGSTVEMIGDHGVERLAEVLALEESTVLHYTADGEEVIAAVLPLESDRIPQTDWMIFNIVNRAHLDGEIGRARVGAYRAAGVLLGCIAIALFLFLMLERDHARRAQADADELRKREERAYYAARHDSLTGLYNRETFFQRASEMVVSQPPGYYMMASIDVDGFKLLNDLYGVEKADQVLRHIGNTFRLGLWPKGGICCRISADDFAALYPARWAQSGALEEIWAAASKVGGGMNSVVLATGCYRVDDLSLGITGMYDRAAMACSSVKGRFDVHLANYDDAMGERLMEAETISREMVSALEGRQFEVWFQPQYNHETGAMMGAEALARWRHPTKGLIPPGLFIPLFERNGFVYELDKYIWEETCRYIRRWMDQGLSPLPVSVNVSRYDIFQASFYAVITGLVRRYDIPVEQLRLEVTESAFTKDTDQIIEMIKQLRSFGFTVEIDDFGSGYSSLNTLKDVPADVLKLDMRFLEHSEYSQQGGSILESVVRMAKWLGMAVVAEGVETVEQADFLASVGCTYIQGYLYARPMPVADYEALFAQAEQEERMISLETVREMNRNSFWDPNSIATLVFNSYVGGACVMELTDTRCEMIRLNAKCREVLRTKCSTAEILRHDPLGSVSADDAARMRAMVCTAAKTGQEVTNDFSVTLYYDQPAHCEHIRVTARVIARTQNSHIVYMLMENVTDQEKTRQEMEETSEQLQILNDISRKLLAEEDSRKVVDSILRVLLRYFDGRRVSLLEPGKGGGTLSVQYEVCADGVSGVGEAFQELPIESVHAWISAFEKNNHLIIPRTEDLDKSRSAEQQLLEQQGIRSLLLVPVRRDGALIGILGVDNPGRKLDHVGRLAAMGDFLAVVLTRRVFLERIAGDRAVLHGLLDDLPGGFVRMAVDEQGGTVPQIVNSHYCDLVDMSRDEIMALYSGDMALALHPEDRVIFRRAVEDALFCGRVVSVRARFLHGQKEYVVLRVFFQAATDPRGQRVLNAFFANMAGEHAGEEELRHLLDRLPCGISLYEMRDGRMNEMYLSRRAMKLYGMDGDEPEGASMVKAGIHPDDRGTLMSGVAQALEQGGNISCVIRLVNKSQNLERPIHIVGTVERQEGDTLRIYSLCFPDQEALEGLDHCLGSGLVSQQDLVARLTERHYGVYIISAEEDRVWPVKASSGWRAWRGEGGPCRCIELIQLVDLLVAEGDRELVRRFLAPVHLSGLSPAAGENWGITYQERSGAWRQATLYPLRARGGMADAVLLTVSDITESCRQLAMLSSTAEEQEQQARHQYQLLAGAMEDPNADTWLIDLNADKVSTISYADGSFLEQPMAEPWSYYYRNLLQSLHPDDREKVQSRTEPSVLRAMPNGARVSYDCRRVAGDGGYRWFASQMRVFRGAGDYVNVVFHNRDVTDQMDEVARLRDLAEHDGLTDLFNRTKLDAMLRTEYRDLASCGVIFCDLDGLKEVNDTRGHGAGDQALVQAAQVLRSVVNRRIHAYRYGGDEFVVVICDGDREEIQLMASMLQSQIRKRRREGSCTCTLSIGTAWSAAPLDVSEMIHMADAQMYSGKKAKADRDNAAD